MNIELYRKHQLIGILEKICQNLELSPTQYKDAEQKYKAVGTWLIGSDDKRLFYLKIYSQGSMKLGTTNKPIGQDEFDIDLICHVYSIDRNTSSKELNRMIGGRLREHKKYREILKPLNRGWRLDYANEFHLDITPCIDDVSYNNGSVLVPDREQKSWKPSNPDGYAKWFENHAALTPSFRRDFSRVDFFGTDANIEPLPEPQTFKGILKRSVQLFKRHRDILFQEKNSKSAPISIIITTLAAQSYKKCVLERRYDNEFDVLIDILKNMPYFIEVKNHNGIKIYNIPNETNRGENFAEKWNVHPERAESFFNWRNTAIKAFTELANCEGLDDTGMRLSELFGKSVAGKSLNGLTNNINRFRKSGALYVAPTVGLSTNSVLGSEVKQNTFFGA